MGKVILNETPVRTSNNYGINDISLDIEFPKISTFENISIEANEENLIIDNSNMGQDIKSKIGLELRNNYGVILTVLKNTRVKEPIRITFDFDDDNTTLADNIKIIMEEGSSANFIIEYISEDNEIESFHYLKQDTICRDNSKVSIVIANLLNDNSDSFIAINNELEVNAKVEHTIVDFGGKTKISNYYTKLNGIKSENYLKTIYLGTNNDILDINYNIEEYGKNTKCNIEVQGAIAKNAKKNFKGIIDFKEGASKSKGIENENCVILSDSAKSKSMPVLLCHEEDVEGEHRSIIR